MAQKALAQTAGNAFRGSAVDARYAHPRLIDLNRPATNTRHPREAEPALPTQKRCTATPGFFSVTPWGRGSLLNWARVRTRSGARSTPLSRGSIHAAVAPQAAAGP
jgi:hypothetical protein